MENEINSALGITDLLIDAINKKYDGIRDLNSLKVNISEEDFEEMNPVIDSIIEDENNHIGKLQQLVDLLSGGTDEIEEGRAETIEIIDTGNSVVESITTMKKKLILSENFDNVIDDVQAVADPVFVGANEEHDENKKKYEDAIEENKKEAEDTVPKEGETGEKVKSKALKQMHLSEKLFDEELTSDFAQYCADNISEYILTEFVDLKNSEIRQVLRVVMDHFRGSDFDESLNEDLSFEDYDEFNHKLYNAIADVMFDFRDKGTTKNDLDKAIEWFNIHFWDNEYDEYYEDEVDESLNEARTSDQNKELLKIIASDLSDEEKLKKIKAYISSIEEALNEARTSEQNKKILSILASDDSDEDKLKKIKKYLKSISESLNEAYENVTIGLYGDEEDFPIGENFRSFLEKCRKQGVRISNGNENGYGEWEVNLTGNGLTIYKLCRDISGYSRPDISAYNWIDEYSITPEKEVWVESLHESIQYSIAKEQIKRFTEGKMPKNWNVDSYLTKLTEKKHINKKEAKSLKEWYSTLEK